MPVPKVSILTPTFNHEKFISDCIESVLKQTYPNWEMIIIDDGSNDRTPEIVRQYDDKRITFIQENHRGITCLGEIYNFALEKSKGEFILILEGDDYIPINRIEIQLPSLKNERVVLSHGRYAYVYGERSEVSPIASPDNFLKNQPVGSALKVLLQGVNLIGTTSVMIRKSALVEIGGFTQPSYLPLVDYPTWMRLALKGPFVFIPEILGFWRRHSHSVSMNRIEDIFYGFIRYCDEFIRDYQEELNQIDLMKFMKNSGAIAYLSLAWIQLSNHNWERALRLSKQAWDRREVLNWSFKKKVLLGFLGSYVHRDIPGYLKRVRRYIH